MLGYLVLLGTLQVSVPGDTNIVVPVSLPEAIRRALATSPQVEAARGEVHRARGIRGESRWPLVGDPLLGLDRTRRVNGSGTSYDRGWSVEQDLDIAGQWLFRRGGGNALTRAAEAGVTDAERRVARETRRRFIALVVAQRRASLADSAAAFAGRLATFAQRQFDAGEMNRLEANAASLERGRAQSEASRRRSERFAAMQSLAVWLGYRGDTLPDPVAPGPTPAIPPSPTADLVSIARERRPDYRVAEQVFRSAELFRRAARLTWIPTLAVSVSGGEEGGSDRLRGVGIGLRVPLLARGQATRGAATADYASSHAALVQAERDLVSEVRSALTSYLLAQEAEQRFQVDVLTAAEENVILTERALAEGELSLTEVLLLRRTALDAQLEYLEVFANRYNAWFDLAAALGVEPEAVPAILGTTEN